MKKWLVHEEAVKIKKGSDKSQTPNRAFEKIAEVWPRQRFRCCYVRGSQSLKLGIREFGQ